MELILALFLSFFFPFVWVYYLNKKDCHPEPKLWLFLAFLLGIVSAFLSSLTQFYLEKIFLENNNFYFFLSAFIEEFFKFLVIYIFIMPLYVFNEPVDGMIYMIFSALGFAFLENLFLVLKETGQIIQILFLRFLGANFLHVSASALIGLGYSFMKKTHNFLIFLISFLGAVFLHFLYNIIIIKGLIFFLTLPILWSVFLIVLLETNFLKDDHKSRK